MALTPDQSGLIDRVITALAGPSARLRDDQLVAVEGLMSPGARVLVVQATGWGKSAVYWVATALRRAAGAGPTLVISPLLSLMRDQVVAAQRAGLRAATLNSSNIGAWREIEAALLADELDVLLVSPERLANPGFGRRVMNGLSGRLGLLVIDEAHSVSDWGHDFRPDYRRVARTMAELDPSAPVLATTATANQRVTDDVAEQLGAATLVLRGPLARTSLHLAVIDRLTPLQRFAWVVENLPLLPGSGIIYVLTVADAHRLTEAIRAQHPGIPVAAYTGQVDTAEREKLENALLANELKALVSTSALGMGYDKPDLGFCVHVGAPPSPVSYYQQVGRAGRAIDKAVVVLLAATSDESVWEYFITASIPLEAEVERLLAAVPSGEPRSSPAIEAESGLRRTKVELLLKQLAVAEVVERLEEGWVRTGKPWTFDAEHFDGVVAMRRREAAIMRDFTHGRQCLMMLLQEALDDPSAAPCGRCSVCVGALPEGLSAEPSEQTLRDVGGVLRSQAVIIEPRKMWPGGAFGARGRIAADELAEEGRALIHADAPEWASLRSTVFERDGEASDELVAATVALLTGWRRSWPARPEVVVGLPAAGFEALTADLVRRVGEVGRMDTSAITVSGRPGSELVAADEAAAWRDSLRVAEPDAVSGRVVLLIVDATASLWPATVAAALLRRSGSRMVLPLILHRRV